MEHNDLNVVTNTVLSKAMLIFHELSSAKCLTHNSISKRWDPSEPGVAELLKQGANINFCKYALLCKYVSTDPPWVNEHFHVFTSQVFTFHFQAMMTRSFVKNYPNNKLHKIVFHVLNFLKTKHMNRAAS